jgi:hypothetical protein
MRRAVAGWAVAFVFLASCGGGAAEGHSEATPSGTEAVPIQVTESLPWAPPTANELLGKWDQEGQRVVVWFKPDGTFAIDNHGRLETDPFADGTFELEESTVTFTSDPGGGCGGATFVWEVGLDEGGSDDRLQVLVTKGACGALTGEQWTFARVG